MANHHPARGLASKKSAFQIDGNRVIESSSRDILRGILRCHSYIVDQRVQLAEVRDGVVHCEKYLMAPGHVHLQGEHPPPKGCNLPRQFASGAHVTQAQSNIRASVGKRKSDGATQATRRPAYQYHVARQIEIAEMGSSHSLPKPRPHESIVHGVSKSTAVKVVVYVAG